MPTKQWYCERCGRFFTNPYELKRDGLSIGDIFVHGPDECGPVRKVVEKGNNMARSDDLDSTYQPYVGRTPGVCPKHPLHSIPCPICAMDSGTKDERQKIADMMGVSLDQIHRFDITPEGALVEVPDKSKIEFWGFEDDDRLSYDSVDELIENYLDELGPPAPQFPTPEKLIVVGYARKELTLDDIPSLLEEYLERIDEEFGDPEGDYSEITEVMKKAEDTFREVLRKEYFVWMCEPVTKEEINVADWIKENRPDWLEGK